MCLEVNGLGKISERLRCAKRYRSLRYLLDPQTQHNAHDDFDGKVERSERTDRCMNLFTRQGCGKQHEIPEPVEASQGKQLPLGSPEGGTT